VNVFSLPTCETLSYSIDKSMTVADLQTQICRDIALETDDQTLLLPDGKSVNPKANLLSSLSNKVSIIIIIISSLMKQRS